MPSQTPSGTGSGSSESRAEAPAPFMDLTGGPLERAEKPPDLDRMVTMTKSEMPDETPEAPQAEKMPIKEMPPSSKKKKSKQIRKAMREGAAEASTSMLRVPGPKKAAFQEAIDEIALREDETAVREELDRDFGKLPEPEQPAPPGVQAPAVILQETAPTEGEWMDEDSRAALPRDA